MIYFEKSQPAPECLEKEKLKQNGDYKCGDVLNRLKDDFKNKCYICETKEPTNINVEHFKSHSENPDLKFDWNNLFLACGHCNNTKLDKFDNLLDCTNLNDKIESQLKYFFNPFPLEKVAIETANDDEKSTATKNLLLAVFNGTTKLKIIESANLRNQLLEEIRDFQKHLCDYYKAHNDEDKDHHRRKILSHLNAASAFTAFKRQIIKNNPNLLNEFGYCF